MGCFVKLHELVKSYDLHDSLVEGIHYLPEQNKVIIDSEHYVWNVLPNDASMVAEKLVFSNVTKYEIIAPNPTFDCDQIATAKISLVEGKENIEIIILEDTGGVKKVYIEAEEVEWQPANSN